MTTNNTTGTAKVTVMEYPDVRGKLLMYLKVEANGKEYIINVGKETYTKVADVLTPRETTTVINVLKPEGGIK